MKFTATLYRSVLILLLVLLGAVQPLHAQDSLAKYTNEELLDKAFQTRQRFYLTYLEKRKLNEDEQKMLYQDLGSSLISDGVLDSAMHYYQKLDTLASKTKDDFQAFVAKISIAEVLYRQKEYTRSQQFFEAAQQYIAKFPEGRERILADAEYSYFYYLSGKFDLYVAENEKNLKAMNTLLEQRNLDNYERLYLIMSKVTLEVFLAKGYIMQEQFDQAASYLQDAKALLDKYFPNEVHLMGIDQQLGMGQLHLFKKEYEQANTYLKEVIQLGEENNHKEYTYKAHVFLAIAQYQQGNYQAALQEAEAAIQGKIGVADYIDFEMESLRYAYLSAKELDETEKAMEYSRQFIEQDAALNDNKKSNFVNSFINNLEVNKLEDDLKKKSETNYLLRYSLFGFGFLILGLILFGYYQLRENKKIKVKIREYMAKLDEPEEVLEPQDTHAEEEEVQAIQPDSKPRVEEIDEKTTRILEKLKDFEHGDLFVDSKMSLAFLASYLGTNTITLSKVINTHKQMNFNDYINGLRIRYIIERIKNEPQFEQYKIAYLAEVSGFSSHSIFSKAFKKSTGVTPSQFLEYLKEEASQV